MRNNEEYVLAGVVMKSRLSVFDTGGALSIFENRSFGPSKTPIHMHEYKDETLYVLEGEMLASLQGTEQTISAGQSIFLPRRIPHQLVNASGKPTRYLLICTPGGFESFIEEAGHARAVDEIPLTPSLDELNRLRGVAPRFGISVLASW